MQALGDSASMGGLDCRCRVELEHYDLAEKHHGSPPIYLPSHPAVHLLVRCTDRLRSTRGAHREIASPDDTPRLGTG